MLTKLFGQLGDKWSSNLPPVNEEELRMWLLLNTGKQVQR